MTRRALALPRRFARLRRQAFDLGSYGTRRRLLNGIAPIHGFNPGQKS
jgi:hypothetical protein